MGGHGRSSCPTCNCPCNSEKQKINVLEGEINTEKKQIADLQAKLKAAKEKSLKTASDLQKLRQMCMVRDGEEAQATGERIYGLMNKRYMENLELMKTQQQLVDRQNRNIGKSDIILSEQKERLFQLENNITQNNRQLSYDNQLYHGDNKWINGLKVSAGVLIVALILVMILSAFKTLKK